jgi:biotin carboxyl carrier protein
LCCLEERFFFLTEIKAFIAMEDKVEASVNGKVFLVDSSSVPGDLPKLSGFEPELHGDSRAGFTVAWKGKTYNAFVVQADHQARTYVLRINNRRVEVNLKDSQDKIAEQWGLVSTSNKKINELKSPMPGMVLELLVREGDTVRKGDPLLVLEAMKMENILRSPGELRIAGISVEKGKAVDKNQILMQFSEV